MFSHLFFPHFLSYSHLESFYFVKLTLSRPVKYSANELITKTYVRPTNCNNCYAISNEIHADDLEGTVIMKNVMVYPLALFQGV